MQRSSIRDIVAGSAHYEAISYARSDDDVEAWASFARAAHGLVGAPAAAVAQAFWAARWRNQGFPRLVVGPRRAASLMATGIAAEQMADVLPPWKAFLVELTDSPVFLVAPTEPEGRSPIDRVEVQVATHHLGRPAWSMLAESVCGVSIHRFNVAPEEWINDRLQHEGPVDAFSAEEMGDEDLRALSVLSRLVAGLCMMLGPDDARAVAERRGKSYSYRQRRRGPPLLHDYVLGDDVKLDVRDAISEYVARGGRTPKVQSLVRGHWKRQFHGAKRALRKWIHVEPYWRGEEDMPIVMRRHRIAEEDPS